MFNFNNFTMNQEPKRDLHDPKVDHDHVHERNTPVGGAGGYGGSANTDYKKPMSSTELAIYAGFVLVGFILGLIVGSFRIL